MSNELPPASDYASILRNSIHRETIARMVCTSCRQTNHLRIRRVLADGMLPPVLVINAGVRTSDELDIWIDGRQGPGTVFLQPRFSLGRNGDAVVVSTQPELDKTVDGVTYELTVRSFVLLSCAALFADSALLAGDGRPDSCGR